MNQRILVPIGSLIVGVAAGWLIARAQFRETSVQPAAGTMETVADAPAGAPGDSPLDTLDWLVGEWVDTSDDVSVEFNCHYTKNGAFIVRSFRVVNAKGVAMAGMQLIAWDAARDSIRSWTFDSHGGFGEETWTQSGNRYTIRSKYTLPDGGTGSNIQVVTYIDDNSFKWKSVDREIDGELQPDTNEITIVRKTGDDSAKGEK